MDSACHDGSAHHEGESRKDQGYLAEHYTLSDAKPFCASEHLCINFASIPAGPAAAMQEAYAVVAPISASSSLPPLQIDPALKDCPREEPFGQVVRKEVALVLQSAPYDPKAWIARSRKLPPWQTGIGKRQ